jgi:hypothetical protein
MRSFIYCLALLAFFSFTACTGKSSVPLDVMYQYQPPEGEAPRPRAVVEVRPFTDNRGKPSSIIGAKTSPDGLESDIVVSSTVSETVTRRLIEALRARGFTVIDAGSPVTSPDDAGWKRADIILGGEIRVLWVEAIALPESTSLKADVQLHISVVESVDKKKVRGFNVNRRLDRRNVELSSTRSMEELLARAFSFTIDRIFEDQELRQSMY